MARYDLCRPCLEALKGKGRKLYLAQGGVDHKITCHNCQRRRYGATYSDVPVEQKNTKSKAKA